MNLQDTVQALEAKGVTVALDVGVHRYCSLDSNCPLAVQLRRLTTDADITLEQLLEGYQEATAPDPVDYTLPEFDGRVTLKIAGKDLELDFNDVISEQIRITVERKLREIEGISNDVRRTGTSLYQSYLREIQRQRSSQVLPQMDYSVSSLLEAGCLITGSDRIYIFLFPSEYNPQYIIRNGTRYKLSDDDITAIKTKIYFKLTVTKEGKFLRADVLNTGGNKFFHYHGDRNYDCWGEVVLPERWDRRLASLSRLVHTLVMSLTTINYNSLLMREPPHMPYIDGLLERSTELGREGEIEETPVATPAIRTRWGRRRQE